MLISSDSLYALQTYSLKDNVNASYLSCEDPWGRVILHEQFFYAYKHDIAPSGKTCLDIEEQRQCNNGRLTGSYMHEFCSEDKPCMTGEGSRVEHGEVVELYREQEALEFPECLKQKRRCNQGCLLYTSPSPRDQRGSRMPSSA